MTTVSWLIPAFSSHILKDADVLPPGGILQTLQNTFKCVSLSNSKQTENCELCATSCLEIFTVFLCSGQEEKMVIFVSHLSTSLLVCSNSIVSEKEALLESQLLENTENFASRYF